MRKFNNAVYILGGDHHNTLAAIRCFGKEHYDIKIGVLSDKATKISGSKYAKGKITILPDENSTITWLISEQKKFNDKSFIIPCSDLAEYIIDTHYDELAERYYIPGFSGNSGRVSILMDKYEQKKLADRFGIKMADTWQIDLDKVELQGICFPCIVKPEISAFGSKTDIRVFNVKDELKAAIDDYRQAGYKVLLCQQFLKKKIEVCAYGYIPKGTGSYSGAIIQKIHENNGGSTAFAKFVDDPELNSEVDKLCSLLQKEGYNGLYDFEYLVCEDGVYLNEINFRQSGNEYATVNLGHPSPLLWAYSMLGIDSTTAKNLVGKYHMDDVGELIAVKHRTLSFRGFFMDLIKSRNCSVLNFRDIPGTISYYKSLL